MGKINRQILAIQKQYFGSESKLLSKFDSGNLTLEKDEAKKNHAVITKTAELYL